MALQWQDRERPGGQEMLLGAATMVALMRHGGDDRRLAVGPALRRDAGLLAQRRARAVGRDQQFRGDHAAVALRHDDAIRLRLEARDRDRAQVDTRLARLCGKRRVERAVLDHVSKWLTR